MPNFFELAKQHSDTLLVTVVGIIAVFLMIEPVVSLPLLLPRGYNEGWNAFHSTRAVEGLPLYPEVTALITNNYPPLSFYIVGAIGSIIGDHIIAGRIISLMSLCVVSLNIGLIVWRLGKEKTAAVFSALLFVAYFAAHYRSYVAINDPQLLAHAIMTSGLVVFLKGQTWVRLLVASFLCVSAGFVKHSLIPMPIALSLWLVFRDRRSSFIWLAHSVLFLGMYFVLFYEMHGYSFLQGLFGTPRSYSLRHLVLTLPSLLTPLSPLLGANFILIAMAYRDQAVGLIALYIIIAGAWGVIITGGAGIVENAMFDLLASLVMGAGVLLTRLLEWGRTTGKQQAYVRMAVMAMLMLSVLIHLPIRVFETRAFLLSLDAKTSSVQADIRFLSSQNGPVMCEILALCYWAGKSFEVDFSNTTQKVYAGVINGSKLSRLLDSHYFAAIQIDTNAGFPKSSFLPEAINKVLSKTYQVHHSNEIEGVWALYFIPKTDNVLQSRTERIGVRRDY